MTRSLREGVEALRGRHIALVGDFILDEYIYGDTVRVSREAPVPVVLRKSTEHRLGGAANTVRSLVALGARVTICGTLGRDDAGAHVRSLLEGLPGVEARFVERDGATTVKTRVLAGAFGTAKQQILRLDAEPNGSLSDSVEAELCAEVARVVDGADGLIISDYGLGDIGPKVRTSLTKLFTANPTFVDSRFALDGFQGARAVTPNIPEAEALVGFSIQTTSDVDRAGLKLIEILGVDEVLLTQGRGGMSLYRREGLAGHVDITGDEEVTDVTGAGDTVMATFALGSVSGIGSLNAMRLSNVAAGVVVNKLGASTCSNEELLQAGETAGLELESW